MTANPRWILAALAGMALFGCKKDKAEAEKPAASAQTLEKKPALSDKERKAERRRDPTALLERFDANKDGKLEVAELPERRRERFGMADTNKDGFISREELEKFGSLAGKGMMDPSVMLSQMDANKDGKLESSEIPQHRRDRLMASDANKDGALSQDELKAHIEARRRQRSAP